MKSALNRAALDGYGNDVTNWTASIADGTPGIENAGFDLTAPTSPTGVASSVTVGPVVQLVWTESADPETGVDLYRIYRNDQLVGTSATARFSDPDVSLVTNYTYTVSAVNRQGLEGQRSLPHLVNVMSAGSIVARRQDQVVFVFSEPVTPASAEAPANYAIDNGVQVLSAVLSSDRQTVTLTTSPMVESTAYQLTINNIASQIGSHFPPDFHIPFQYIEGVPGFTVRGVKSARTRIRSLATADQFLTRPPDDPSVAADRTLIFSTVNFRDDDGQAASGFFDGNLRFPTDQTGDDDDFVIQASGIVTVPEGQGGDWTFGVSLAPTDPASGGNALVRARFHVEIPRRWVGPGKCLDGARFR